MSLHLTADDSRRLTLAADAMLTEPGEGGVDGWWRGVEPRLRALFPRANVMLTVPYGPRLRNSSESVEPAALRRLGELAAADPATGRFLIPDPIVIPWMEYRRANRIGVWSEARNRVVLQSFGLENDRSMWYNEGLLAARLYDYAGLSSDAPAEEWFVTIGYDRRAASRFGDDEPVIGLLLPAFRAAHQALAAAHDRRAALGGTLDALPDGVLVLGGDGRELHRNRALRELLAGEPERERVRETMLAMARELAALRRGRPHAVVPTATRTVAGTFQRLTLHASFASAALWGMEGVVQVVAQCAPRGATADAGVDAAPDAGGLTARESEVARLLARRATDAEIAAALGISWHTARRHTERVLQKLGVRSRRDLARTEAPVS